MTSGGDTKASKPPVAVDSWVARKVRATTVRLSVAWFLAVCAVLAALWSQRRYIVNYVGGPYVVGAEELDRISDVSLEPRYFVRVASTDVSDTGAPSTSGTSEGADLSTPNLDGGGDKS